ncbi:MAG TPA: hypothetical protein VMU84_13715, partial [Thermoanaerobaculia bacterium]|nr:hypothetical protein [Thermoanaerobaculia bacterium]
EGKQKLVINVPGAMFVEAEGPDGALVKYEVSASGTDDPNPEVNCDPKSGSLFALGGSTVKCTAKDRFGATAEDSFEVTVMDTIAPMILKVSASPNALTPVEGQFVDVTISVDAKDSVDAMPRCAVADVTSKEAIDGDWFVAKDLLVQLRAEGDGRIYTVNVRCSDTHDNFSSSSVDVRVGAGAGALSGSPTTTAPPSKRRAGGQ